MNSAGRTTQVAQFRYRFGRTEFDESRFELRVDGRVVDVQRKPLEVLSLLLSKAGEVLTRQELLDTVWEGRPTVDNVVANALTKLRTALGEPDGSRIVTLPRIGYRFDGPLERVAVGRLAPSALGLEAGQHLPARPNFQLLERIGQSASNEVWLTQHVKSRERRVFKFCIDGQYLPLLKRELTLSRLLQDNIGAQADGFSRVLDWNLETPPFFLECEYGGLDLLCWSKTEGHLDAMPLDQRLNLFLQAADAVAAAHSIGVLHKDLKPANMLVANEQTGWRLRITDFGSSHLLDPQRLAELGITRLGFTMTGSLLADSAIGTPLYLAPEVIAGQPPTAASDVYALGVILYQLIVGDLNRPLVPGWERGVPDPLLCEDIALATDGDPARRLASADELARRLRSLTVRRTELAARQAEEATRRAQQAARRKRRGRLWLIATAIAAAALSATLATLSRPGAGAQLISSEDRVPLKRFYAEVMDVYRHYLFTDEELVADRADAAFRLQLNLALYGEAPFTRGQIDEVGLLPGEIPLVMELLLLIRNNDLRIADILSERETDPHVVGQQIETLRERVRSTRDTAYAILESLHQRGPQLGELPPRPPR